MVRVSPVLFTRFAESLTYSSYGQPSSVIRLTSAPLPDFTPCDVRIKILATTVNPSDYNQIEGTYPIKPELPAVGGNEGVGEVVEVGQAVTALTVGDRVIPAVAGFGTWRTEAVCDQSHVKRIPDMDIISSAMLAVNPCTAYRMLEDYNRPVDGGWVIQNGANSAVGRAVIQMCRVRGWKSINIIRHRENDGLKDELLALGATKVFYDKEDAQLSAFCKKITPPGLAFNMVSGRATIPLLKSIGPDSALVTYGAMSKLPMSVPFGLTVFKNVTLHSYWMSRWTKQWARSEREEKMFSEIAGWCNSGELVPPPYEERELREYSEAMDNAFNRKQIFINK